ncbi:MAG: hypothetical protein RLZZ601_1230 [Pseudomonadota bacterium]
MKKSLALVAMLAIALAACGPLKSGFFIGWYF